MTEAPAPPSVHMEVAEPDQWASRAADVFEVAIKSAAAARGRCVVALSGGGTPAPAFAELAGRELPWEKVVFTQADERVAPLGSDHRNLTTQFEAFEGLGARWLPLPVAEPLDRRLEEYIRDLSEAAGSPPVIDLVHLGLGTDGHTASLVPGDPILDVDDTDVARTEPYHGRPRVTATRPLIDRARLVVWLVRGEDKAAVLEAWLAGDQSFPAGLVRPRQSVVVADEAAANAPAAPTGLTSPRQER